MEESLFIIITFRIAKSINYLVRLRLSYKNVGYPRTKDIGGAICLGLVLKTIMGYVIVSPWMLSLSINRSTWNSETHFCNDL